MRQLTLIFLVSVLVFCFSPFLINAQSRIEIGESQLITLEAGSLSTEVDVRTEAEDILVINLEGRSEAADPYLIFGQYDSSRTNFRQIASNDDTDGLNSRVVIFIAESGTYTIQVTTYQAVNNNSNPSSLDFSLSVDNDPRYSTLAVNSETGEVQGSNGANNSQEANGLGEAANPLNIGSTSFTLPQGEPYVEFDVVISGAISLGFRLEAVSEEADPFIVIGLYDSNHSEFVEIDRLNDLNGSPNPELGLQFEEPKIITVRAGTFESIIGGSAAQDYDLLLTLTENPQNLEELKNGDVLEANGLLAPSGLIYLNQERLIRFEPGMQSADLQLHLRSSDNLNAPLTARVSNLSFGVQPQLELGQLENEDFQAEFVAERNPESRSAFIDNLPNDVNYTVRVSLPEPAETDTIVSVLVRAMVEGDFPPPAFEPTGDCLADAQRALEVFYYEELYELADCAVQESPDDELAILLRHYGSYVDENYEAALADAERLTELDPSNNFYASRVAYTYVEMGRWQEALDAFDHAIALGCERSCKGGYRGLALAGLFRYEEAIEAFTLSLGFSVQGSRFLIERGNAYLALQRYEEAELDYLRYLGFGSTSREGVFGAYWGLGLVRLANRDYEGAIHAFDTASLILPDDLRPLRLKVFILLESNRLDEALALSQAGLEQLPEDVSLLTLLARIQAASGDDEAAFATIEQGLALDPQRMSQTAVEIYFNAGEATRGLALLESLPSGSLSHAYRSAILLQSGDTTGAEEAYQSFLQVYNNPGAQPITEAVSMNVNISGGQMQRLAFEGQAGQTVIITANAIAAPYVDPTLILVSPSGSVIAIDNNGGAFTDAALVDFVLPETGSYEIAVANFTNITGDVAVTITGVHLVEDADQCSALVETAYTITQEVCSGVAGDQVCYGNALISEQPQLASFENSGDLSNLGEIDALSLAAMDTVTNTWGVSLMTLQAFVESGELAPVDVVMFGEVEIGSFGAITPQAAVEAVNLQVNSNANVRSAPSTSGEVVGSLAAGDTVDSTGRNETNDWYFINLGNGQVGWVFAQLVSPNGDVSTLPILNDSGEPIIPVDSSDTTGGTQAFTFRSGTNDRPCDAAPDSGLLIQTPDGYGRITLFINDVLIDMGSTVYLTAQPGREMFVYLLEGSAEIESQNIRIPMPAGTYMRIPLDSQGRAADVPDGPYPYTLDFGRLPLELLTTTVEPSPAPTEFVLEGTPEEGIYTLFYGGGGAICHQYEDSEMMLEVLNHGRTIRLISADLTISLDMIEPGHYVSRPGPRSGIAIGGSFEDGVAVNRPSPDHEYWDLVFDGNIARGTSTRLRYSLNLGNFQLGDDIDPVDGCDVSETSFGLGLQTR